jgi:hypothetical protein
MTYPKLIPTRAEVEAAALVQRAERHRLARRVDDAPETILFDDRMGRTPGFDEPVPRWLRLWRRFRNWFR